MVEMVHDTRIVRIANSRDVRAASLDKWMGDSIGRWEGDTLIVETKHYHPVQTYRGAPTENLTVIETFRREGPNKIIYGFTVDDPPVYTPLNGPENILFQEWKSPYMNTLATRVSMASSASWQGHVGLRSCRKSASSGRSTSNP